MKSKFKLSVIILAVISVSIFIFSACQHKPKEIINPAQKTDTTKIISTNCNKDSVYFVNTILPLLISNCNGSGCHNANDAAEDVVLNNYSNIINYVKAGDAAGSKLYKNITTAKDIMPPSGKLPQATLDIIAKWINQGAKNNYCTDGCDTTKYTYGAVISKVITNNCAGCHNTGTTKIGTYAELKTQVDNGKLWGAINHTNGFLPMPSNSTFLQACEIKQIEKWIAAGALNN